MKTITKLLMFLLALSLCGCKTKEKVTERLSETVRSNSSSVQMITEEKEVAGQATVQEASTRTQQSDSTVEHFFERIVTDSTGRVLLHEVEHSKDTYKGSGSQQTKYTGNREGKKTTQHQELSAVRKDSTYNGGTLREVTVVKSKSRKWVWFVGLLSLLFIVGFIISKIVRK